MSEDKGVFASPTDPHANRGDPRPRWRAADDVPPHEDRPIRQWVHVEGVCEHHGSVWARAFIGEAVIRREGSDDERQGYRASDLAEIERRGDMDPGTGLVTHWMGVSFPPIPAKALNASGAAGGSAINPEPNQPTERKEP